MEQLRLERSSETSQCHPPATGRELPQQRDGNSSWPHKCACWRASRVVGINNIYFNAFLLLCNHGGASWGCSSEESHTAPQDRVLAKPKFYILFPETEKHVEAPQFFYKCGFAGKNKRYNRWEFGLCNEGGRPSSQNTPTPAPFRPQVLCPSYLKRSKISFFSLFPFEMFLPESRRGVVTPPCPSKGSQHLHPPHTPELRLLLLLSPAQPPVRDQSTPQRLEAVGGL